MRTAKTCGPDLPTLGSSRRKLFCRRRWLKKPGHRGEHAHKPKTIAQGAPACSAVPVVSNSCAFYLAHEAAGAASIRCSLRPPSREGPTIEQNSGALRREIAVRCSIDGRSTRRAEVRTWSRPSALRRAGWGTWIRTKTNRVRVCCATVTPFPNGFPNNFNGLERCSEAERK